MVDFGLVFGNVAQSIFGIASATAQGRVYSPEKKKVIGQPGDITKVVPIIGGVGTRMFGVAGGGVGLSKTVVNLPWKPIAIGGGGLLAGYTLFGKKGTDQTQALTQQQQPIQITKTYSPVTTTTTSTTFSPSYMTISDSPYASMKKADVISSEPSVGVSPTWAISPGQTASQAAEQGQSEGTDMIMLAAVAAVGLVAYGYVSKPKGAKRK